MNLLAASGVSREELDCDTSHLPPLSDEDKQRVWDAFEFPFASTPDPRDDYEYLLRNMLRCENRRADNAGGEPLPNHTRWIIWLLCRIGWVKSQGEKT